jgi:ABC-type nitrate/sulfonate/bicarbonate transport system ATPase subunit
MGPRWGSIPRLTDWLTVSRNVILTLTWQTRPLVREGAPRKQERNCQAEINIWSWAPDGARHQDWLTDWLTYWLTVSRNVTLTWELAVESWALRGEKRWQLQQRIESVSGVVGSWQNYWEVMAKKESGCAKKTSCVIWGYSETVINPLSGYD